MSHSSEQPSTVNRQPSTVNRQPATVDRQPATGNRQPATGNRFLSPLLQVSLKYKGQVQLVINIGMTAHPFKGQIQPLVILYIGITVNPGTIPSHRQICGCSAPKSLHRRCGKGTGVPLPVAPLPVAPLPDAPLPDAPALPA